MNPQKGRKKKTNKVRSMHISRTVLLLALFCVCIGGISLVSAKYIKQSVTKNNSVTAKEFYFESDLLDGQTHQIVSTEDSTTGKTASVIIRLKNHVDELRYSEVNIDYTVTVTEQDGTSAAGVTITNGTGSIPAGASNNIDVTLSGLQSGKTYTVTATTSNIYQKTLTGTIEVAQPDNDIYASISDKTQYIEVTVWTTDYTGNVNLTYAASLMPDNTDNKMTEAKSIDGEITDNNWGANTSHVFRFFKSDTTKKYNVAVSGQEVTVSEK